MIFAISSNSVSVFAEFDVEDPKAVAQLMANISHENGAGTIVRESGNYSAARIVQIFGAPHSSAAVSAALRVHLALVFTFLLLRRQGMGGPAALAGSRRQIHSYMPRRPPPGPTVRIRPRSLPGRRR